MPLFQARPTVEVVECSAVVSGPPHPPLLIPPPRPPLWRSLSAVPLFQATPTPLSPSRPAPHRGGRRVQCRCFRPTPPPPHHPPPRPTMEVVECSAVVSGAPHRGELFEEKARRFTAHSNRLANTAAAVASAGGSNNKRIVEGINAAAQDVSGDPWWPPAAPGGERADDGRIMGG